MMPLRKENSMVKLDVEGQPEISESIDLSKQPYMNDPNCPHRRVIEVEDGTEGCKAYQCQDCMFGWLVRDDHKEDKIKE